MQKAVIQVLPEKIADVDERIYGSFLEHVGRAIYTGIYEPGHPEADDDGFRNDVASLVRDLRVPLVRYPGGNFVSGYEWEDGVGPREQRPTRLDLAWFTRETNQVGLGEFSQWLDKVGAEMMMAVNLGSRGISDARNLVEYCNFPSGTFYSDLRASHGRKEPYGFKLWCLGNEMDGEWQIGHKTAQEYGRIACEAAKVMKWVDPSIELVVCGSSNAGMPSFRTWEETVLRYTYDHVDYLSLHSYYGNPNGDTPTFLAQGIEMDRFIKDVGRVCDRVKAEKGAKKDIYLSFDEWNVWYHSFGEESKSKPWDTVRPLLEDVYNFEDALVVGSLLMTLLNNSDRVRVACLAQLVNAIAPIMTRPGSKAWKQTIYYPYYYTSRYGRGEALRLRLEGPSYVCAVSDETPCLDGACTYLSQDSTLSLFLLNRSPSEDLDVSIDLGPFRAQKLLERVALEGYPYQRSNTNAHPDAVVPSHPQDTCLENGKLSTRLNHSSWNLIRVQIIP